VRIGRVPPVCLGNCLVRDMGETTTVAEERLDGSVPLWLAAHEAGHVIARLQLVAAWQLNGLDNPSSLDAVRVWIDDGGQPKGVCQWG